MLENNSLFGWQERFPLPESFKNPEFRWWVLMLDRDNQLSLAEGIINWQKGRQLNRHEIDAMDEFIGGLVRLKGNGRFFGQLTPRQQGTLLRLSEGLDRGKLM